MIDFLCPRCERFYSVHNKLSGKVANCTCGQKFRVPGLLLVRNKKKYHCPFCRSTAKPVLERKVSTVGLDTICCFYGVLFSNVLDRIVAKRRRESLFRLWYKIG